MPASASPGGSVSATRSRGKPPLFLTRDISIAWLQDQAVAQARALYGPQVRTSIGRCGNIRILCAYLRIPRSAVRWVDDDARLSSAEAAAWAELTAAYESAPPAGHRL